MHRHAVQGPNNTANISLVGHRVSCKRRISASRTEHRRTMLGVQGDRSRIRQSSVAGPPAEGAVELLELAG